MKYVRMFLLTLLLTVCAAIPVQAASGLAEGIDVSHFNGEVDWASVKAQGIQFAMIKTADGLEVPGLDDVDSRFAANYAGAGAVGLKRGVYHVCSHTTVEEAEKEADYCLKILNGRPLEYPVAYDFEDDPFYHRIYEFGKENVTNMAKVFCDKIAAAGYTPMIYSTSRVLSNYFDWSKLNGVKVWVASYNVEKPSFNGVYHMWQYTNEGNITGAGNEDGNCDRDLSFLDVQSIELNCTKKTLGVNKAFTLKATVSPAVFTSSNTKVAEVSSQGVVTGRAKGTAVITVRAGDVTAECVVTVKVPDRVKLPEKSITLKKGRTYKIKPKIVNGAACYKFTYKSSRKSVAAVTSKGKVTAKKKGTATITVKTFNGKTAKLKVKVK